MQPGAWWTRVPSFMEIFQAVKKLNSISRARLNFRRWPVLCTTLYRNPMRASNFRGTFDQLFLWFFYVVFTEDVSLLFLYHSAKKSKMTKNSNQGVGSCWLLTRETWAYTLWVSGIGSVSTCPRLQKQGTRQLSGVKDKSWAKKTSFFSRKWVDWEIGNRFFFGALIIRTI